MSMTTRRVCELERLLRPGHEGQAAGTPPEMFWKILDAVKNKWLSEERRMQHVFVAEVNLPEWSGLQRAHVEGLVIRDSIMLHQLGMEVGYLLLRWPWHCCSVIFLPKLKHILVYDSDEGAKCTSFPRATLDYVTGLRPDSSWVVKLMGLPKQSPDSWDCLVIQAAVASSIILGLELPTDLSTKTVALYRAFFSDCIRDFKHRTGLNRKEWEAKIYKDLKLSVVPRDGLSAGARIVRDAMRASMAVPD